MPLAGWISLFSVSFFPGTGKRSPRQHQAARLAQDLPVLHPPCSVTSSTPPCTRPACPPKAVSFTTMVLGSEARHECVCPSLSRPGPRAISSPIWRPRPGTQWPQVSRWVPEGPGRPGGWTKAVGEGVALDDLMQGHDPCSGGGRCGLVLGDRQPQPLSLPSLSAGRPAWPRLLHAGLQAPGKGSLLPPP